MIEFPKILNNIFDKLLQKDIKPIVVGGYIRDNLLKKNKNSFQNSKDIDVELYNIDSFDQIEEILKQFGKINFLGKSFGVYKLSLEDLEIDFSLPRVDNKISKGHKGFHVEVKPNITFKEAASRRDFTINAIGYDVDSKKILDPYDGIKDLNNGVLKAVDESTFIEDPLRVLRAVQFCARFEFSIDKELLHLCKKMTAENMLDELPRERIFEEIKKLLLKADKPSIGFKILKKLGLLKLFSPLEKIAYKTWHKSLFSLDSMQKNLHFCTNTNITLMLAILSDAIADTYNYDENRYLKNIEKFLYSLSTNKLFFKRIPLLIKYQFIIEKLQNIEPLQQDAVVLDLAQYVNIEELVLFCRVKYISYKKIAKLRVCYRLKTLAISLDVYNKKMQPILRGRDISACGIKPGKEYSNILKSAYSAQITGEFKTYEEAKIWLKNYLS